MNSKNGTCDGASENILMKPHWNAIRQIWNHIQVIKHIFWLHLHAILLMSIQHILRVIQKNAQHCVQNV